MPEENIPAVIKTTKRIKYRKAVKIFTGSIILLTVLIACITPYLLGYYTSIEEDRKRFEATLEDNRELRTVNDEIKATLETYKCKEAAKYEFRIESIERYITTRYTAVPDELANIIALKVVELSDRYDIPVQLVIGVIEVESNFNPFAVSNKRARGLMQVRSEVWADELNMNHEKDLHNIGYGIEAGIVVLKHYLEVSKGDTTEALQRYNGALTGTSYSEKVYKAVGRFAVFQENKRKETSNEDNSSPEENQAAGSQDQQGQPES